MACATLSISEMDGESPDHKPRAFHWHCMLSSSKCSVMKTELQHCPRLDRFISSWFTPVLDLLTSIRFQGEEIPPEQGLLPWDFRSNPALGTGVQCLKEPGAAEK